MNGRNLEGESSRLCHHLCGRKDFNLANIGALRWAGHVACMGEGRGVYRVLVGKPEGKRPLGRPSRRWGDNVRMDLQDVGVRTGLGWLRIGIGGGRL
jgi:hypothetical protein